MILKHRKVTAQKLHQRGSLDELADALPLFQIHLFDIDVPGKIRFQESETLSPGDSLSVFETRKRPLPSPVLRLKPDDGVVTVPRLPLLPQPSVKWAWGFATTSDLQNWHSCTAGKVRFRRAPCCGFRSS